MKKINILITAAGGDIGGNIINILSQQKDKKFNIIGTDINDKIFNFSKVDKFYQVDRVDSKDYLNQIDKIINDNSIDIIIPVSEKEIVWFTLNRSVFKNVEIIINHQNIINVFLNKLETSKELTKINVKTPKTYYFNEFKNQLKFPVIIKGNSSIVTKDIYVVKNKNQLDYLKISIENQHEYIVQEYIGSINDEYTTTVYKSDKKLEVISFKRKLTGGMTSFATIVKEEVLDEYARKIANKFNLEGSINIQSRKVGNEFFIFEINPRFSSTIYIRNHFGFHDLLWSIENILEDKNLNKLDTEVSLTGSAVLGYTYNFFKD